MKLKIIFLVAFLFFASFVCAVDFQQLSEISLIPDFNQPAETNISISGVDAGDYALYTLTDVKLLPASNFYLGTGQNQIKMFVYPTENLVAYSPLTYSFVVVLKKYNSETEYQESMAVRVVSVRSAFEIISGNNMPGDDSIKFYIKNKENINLKNVKASFSSIFFDNEQIFDIASGETKEFAIKVEPEKLKKIEAGSYLLKIIMKTDRGDREIEGRIYFNEKKDIETKILNKGIFVRRNEVSKTNNGNTVEIVDVQMRKDIFSRLFSSMNVAPDKVERKGIFVYYSWTKKLSPSDVLDVKLRTNYLLPFLIIIGIILLAIGIRRYSETKIDILKSVTPVKTKNGQFALKIKLKVKAKRNLKNVSIVEKIPKVAEIFKNFSSETIKPSKIDLNNKRLQWDLGDMNSGEERRFSYIIYSNVGVVGRFMLPGALAVYEREGEIHETESNNVYFLAEQRAIEE